MATQTGSVRVCRENGGVTFQVLGWGRMHQAMPVRRLAESCLAEGAREVHVDLRHCTYLDSTFLGTLLHLRRTAQRRHCGFLLVSPSPECCQLFKQVGIEDWLPATEGSEPPEGWTDVPCEPEPPEVFNRNVLQAHEELANLSSTAGKTFEAVAQGLARDLKGRDIP